MDYIDQIKRAKKDSLMIAVIEQGVTGPYPGMVLTDAPQLILLGDADEINPWIIENKANILYAFCDRRNSKMKLLDISSLNARIEPGAVIRCGVTIKENAVVLMGAIINVGAVIGRHTMIDMNAVIGSGAIIHDYCHIGAGAVISGMMEPISNIPVIIHDHVLIGANATILEGVTIHPYGVVAAGSVVIRDVQPYEIVGGVPAKFLKYRSETNPEKVDIISELREL